MSRTVGSRSAFLFALTLAIASPAGAAELSLGTHLELASLQSDVRNSGSSSVIAWPSNAFGYQPALRLGVGNKSHSNELLVDSGLFMIDEGGSTLSMFVASMNIQHTFSAARTNAAFANAGIGMFREGGAARSSLAASYGAGVGMRHRVHEDHGAIRAEVRGDYLNRSAEFGRPALTTIGLRLGFDLWL